MFKFQLAPLITIRDNILKEKQSELAKAYEARRILGEMQRKIERDLAENAESGRQIMQSGSINVNFLLGLRRQEMFLKADYDDLEKKIQLIEPEIEVRRIAVMEANKELKIVEKLKEKRHEKYQAEERRKETIMMDEIALRRIDNGQ